MHIMRVLYRFCSSCACLKNVWFCCVTFFSVTLNILLAMQLKAYFLVSCCLKLLSQFLSFEKLPIV